MSALSGLPLFETHEENKRRVSAKIGAAISSFMAIHEGREYRNSDLHEFVSATCGPIAPGSADRIARQMRTDGLIAFRVVSRPKSLYLALPRVAP